MVILLAKVKGMERYPSRKGGAAIIRTFKDEQKIGECADFFKKLVKSFCHDQRVVPVIGIIFFPYRLPYKPQGRV